YYAGVKYMKTTFGFFIFIFVVTVTVTSLAQTVTVPAPTPWTITSRSANSRVWERTIYHASPSGQAVPQVQSYTECATGLLLQG
ncbi:MAG: hypothetical protein ACREE6_06990, partial [Limisphaerales bacterium]